MTMASKGLSDEEYVRGIAAIHAHGAAEIAAGKPAEAVLQRCAQAEFDFTIDHRLGRDVPDEVRAHLHAVKQRFADRREALAARLAAGDLAPQDFTAEAHALTEQMIAAAATVLPEERVRLIFTERPGRLV